MNIMQNDNNGVYRCYSPALRKHLGLGGLRWGKKEFNKETNSYYWTFNRSETFEKLLKEYMDSNPH